jgi:serine/threonine protein kinase
MEETDYPPLNAVNATLFNRNKNKNTESELLDNKTIKLISTYDVEMLRIVKSAVKHGEGSYGYVTSAELEFKFKEYRTKRLVAALKVSTPRDTPAYGFSDDIIKECATYARILDSDNLAKGLFVKLSKTSQNLVLEHYSINLKDAFKTMELPWNKRDDLIRAIFFQVASGLKELHERGFIHKDLKPANILLAHDGRLMIADFGLTAYLVKGSDVPQDFYFKSTTDDIEPPEGNHALNTPFIGKSYDIWSLGCVLAYIIRRGMDFNMYDRDEWSMDDWRNQVTLYHYNRARKTILDYFHTNLALRTPKPSDKFMESAKDLLTQMLNTNPSERPTIDDILKHKWFDGLTISNAISIVRQSAGAGPAFGNTWKSKVMTNTRRIRNANTKYRSHRNAEYASYFQIVKQPLVSKFLNDEVHALYKRSFVRLLEIIPDLFKKSRNPPRQCLYAYLHGLELYNRVVLKNRKYSIHLPICFNIALKNTPDNNLYALHYNVIKNMTRFEGPDDYLRLEADIIRLLNGDTYPQVGGLVDKAVRKIGSSKNKVSVARKIIENILERSATFDEYVDVDSVRGNAIYETNAIFKIENNNNTDDDNLLEGFPRIQ